MCHNHGMTVTMDKSGRVVIPKELRKAAKIEADTPLDIRVEFGNIVIEPVCVEPILTYENGLPVFKLPEGVNAKITSEEIQELRDKIIFDRIEGKY